MMGEEIGVTHLSYSGRWIEVTDETRALLAAVECMNERREEDPQSDGEPEESTVLDAAKAWARSVSRASPQHGTETETKR